MNKLLVVARCAKAASEAEIALMLGISPLQYQAIESRQAPVTPDQARKLAAYYAVPAWYFLDAVAALDIEARIGLLRKQHEIISKTAYQELPPGASVALATTILELMIAREELGRSLSRELELAEDLTAITRMYEHLAAAAGRQ